MRRILHILAVVLLLCGRPIPAVGAGDARIDEAISRATAWLRQCEADPFTDPPLSFQLYAVRVECWHRLWATEDDPARRKALEGETISLLRRVLDPGRLEAVLANREGNAVYTEMLVLADRCRAHGVDPSSLTAALRARRDAVLAEARRAPPSIGALYAAYLPVVGIDPPVARAELRSRGMVARRPAEVDLGLADVYYLTHELFAETDYGLRPPAPRSTAEREYLLRVLPFYTVLYACLGKLDIVGELVACMEVEGMRNTAGYMEGIRVLLERQNADGSFGNPDGASQGGTVSAWDYLHPTLNALTALLLERRDADGAGAAGGR
jgi:hypothetical protein